LKILAIIPVYRDIGKAVDLLRRFKKGYVDSIYITIDGSTVDEQNKIRKTAEKTSISFKIVFNEKRKGVGNAIRGGIAYGIAYRFDLAVVLAGNNKDSPNEIARLVAPILEEGVDYVQGSRFLPGGKKVNNPFFRGVFSRLYPFVWTMLTKRKCTDVTNGFRAYNLRLFENPQINIRQSWLDNYELEYYIHYKVLTLGYKTKEVPVSKVYPNSLKGGYSQISPLTDWWKIVGPLIYLKLGARK
jgi:dolichol-phosphate mannosyltransferase